MIQKKLKVRDRERKRKRYRLVQHTNTCRVSMHTGDFKICRRNVQPVRYYISVEGMN